MDVEYTLTEDDFLQLNLHGYEVVPALKWQNMMIRRGIPLGGVAYGIVLTAMAWKGPSSLSDKMLGPVFVGMCFLLLLVFPKLLEYAMRRNVRTLMRARQNSPLGGPLRLMLLPEEIHITTSGSHNSYKWSAILNVTEIPTHYFFWISQRDALIMPKRVFPTPELQKEFEQTFQRYRASYALAA